MSKGLTKLLDKLATEIEEASQECSGLMQANPEDEVMCYVCDFQLKCAKAMRRAIKELSVKSK